MASDAGVTAEDGVKSILFVSPQQNGANRWLVTPLQTIRDNYVVRFYAKSYQGLYPESFEVAVSTTGNNPASNNFTKIASANNVPAEVWTQYEVDLSQYAGQDVYIGFHYVSYDSFLGQIDNVFVGNPSGESTVDVGAVDYYNIYLDGTKVGETETPHYTLTGMSAGEHTIGIEAVYTSGKSEITTYVINTATGINSVSIDKFLDNNAPAYNIAGQRVGKDYKGLVIVNGMKFVRK